MTSISNHNITTFKTIRTFMKVGSCSETLINVLDRAFGHPLPAEERASMPLAGGIAQQGYQCGMLFGASLAAGPRGVPPPYILYLPLSNTGIQFLSSHRYLCICCCCCAVS